MFSSLLLKWKLEYREMVQKFGELKVGKSTAEHPSLFLLDFARL